MQNTFLVYLVWCLLLISRNEDITESLTMFSKFFYKCIDMDYEVFLMMSNF